jgi:glycosyltransferase involved in cell wall biosynthesis
MDMSQKIKVGIVGTRGIPANYGGFETFAEELSIRMVKEDIEVMVYCDKDSYTSTDYQGVTLRFMNVTKTDHPLQYYSRSLNSAIKECDFVIICGNSGALFIMSHLFSKKRPLIATNTDGVEHLRTKWRAPIRAFLRMVEIFAVKLSDYLIADSTGIRNYLLEGYGKGIEKKIEVIEYGAYLNHFRNDEYLASLGLQHDNYYLVVSRLEPENNVDIIIDGYLRSDRKYKLVIVGNLLKTKYVEGLQSKKTNDIIFLGGVYDRRNLEALRYSCKAYFHGHSVGGTNPSLLEALGSGNIVIAHDNRFNRAVTEDKMFYFKDPAECERAIAQFEMLNEEQIATLKTYARKRIETYYNWDEITRRYVQFIRRVVTKK